MSKRMLIDATHAEETRVVVLDGNKLEDYDVESAAKKQLKGNIYLARVIRVEPSLQAAFVEYGANRHGCLAFSEIHPDYYQIPVADREKLLALQAEEESLVDNGADEDDQIAAEAADTADSTDTAAPDETTALVNGEDDGAAPAEAEPEYVSGETDTGEEALIQRRIARFLRNYRIQEVIRRRQILLVQVVKDERGNKGAALTTYISLAGRYCVLMPNALRGGGVSRKITAVSDRRRLRDIISSLNLPRGMAMIVRTAGAQRPGPEITRDCEYLLHLWDNIREHTMQSMAPALIYEEASLVKRAIRDVYTRDVSEILVDGENGWKAARDFMRMLMPQHAEKVRLWNKDQQPLFTHYHVEGHLDAMFSPVVHLRSGGYLVINQTEALVAIDVNSGKATGQRNIEETAFRTNQEAADEVARQLRLRDLAGLVVIDFIDMESRRHNVTIERRLKDALRNDRARIQIGSISHFGLLEMSRQRLRPSVAEATFVPCPHCSGTGMTRSVESSSLHVLRAVEEEGARRRASAITVHVASEIAFYILNHKRDWLEQIEQRHQMEVLFAPDATLLAPEIRIERRQHARAAPAQLPPVENVEADDFEKPEPAQADVHATEPATPESGNAPNAAPGEEEPRRRRRRRRRRRGENGNGQATSAQQGADDAQDDTDEDESEAVSEDEVHDVAQPAATEGNLVQGRRRTRHTRLRRNDRAPEAERTERPAPAQTRDTGRDSTVEIAAGPAPQRIKPVWSGPTPANPFGDEPDIFELLENSVAQRAAQVAPPAKATPVEKAATPETVTAPESVKATPAKEAEPAAPQAEAEAESAPRTRRRTRRKPASEADATAAEQAAETPEKAEPAKARTAKAATKAKSAEEVTSTKAPTEDEAAPAKATKARRAPARKPAKAKPVAEAAAKAPDEAVADAVVAEEAEAPAKPARKRAPRAAAARKAAAEQVEQTVAEPGAAEDDKGEPAVQPIVIEDSPPRASRRTGWWRR
ncbi:MAG: Rne/Rng family ribonuclease [Acetobacter sp.]